MVFVDVPQRGLKHVLKKIPTIPRYRIHYQYIDILKIDNRETIRIVFKSQTRNTVILLTSSASKDIPYCAEIAQSQNFLV